MRLMTRLRNRLIKPRRGWIKDTKKSNISLAWINERDKCLYHDITNTKKPIIPT